MKKVLFVIVFTFAFFNLTKADGTGDDDQPVILTEKLDNPIGGHGGVGKSISVLYIYQSGNIFYFGDEYEGCSVSLLLNNVTVFSTVVDENGQVAIPATLTGSFELHLTVGSVTYWGEVQL